MSTEIKEWRKRLAGEPAGPLAVAVAADAEIAELRAALAEFTPPTPIEGQSDLSKGVLHAIYRACQRGDSPERMHAAVMMALSMSNQAPSAPVAAEDWLRQRYGAARGHHAWRDLAEAFNAGAALSVKAGQAAIPEGWQLVPKEPTPTMLHAAGYRPSGYVLDGQGCSPAHKLWYAMLAAAPTPPTTGEA